MKAMLLTTILLLGVMTMANGEDTRVTMERYTYHTYVRYRDTETGRETIARGGPSPGRGLGAIEGSPNGSSAASTEGVGLVTGDPTNPITVAKKMPMTDTSSVLSRPTMKTRVYESEF